MTRRGLMTVLLALAALASTATAASVENRITMTIRPTTQDDGPVRVAGTISEAKADEEITLQAKDCGQPTFRAVASARTEQGGGWNIRYAPTVSTVLRAVWKDAVSAPVTLRSRVDIRIEPDLSRRNGYEIAVVSKSQLWRKKVLIQLRDRRLGRWKTVKTIVLTDSGAAPGSVYVWSTAELTMRVPKGSSIRAVMPSTQAGPCYHGGYSNTLRR